MYLLYRAIFYRDVFYKGCYTDVSKADEIYGDIQGRCTFYEEYIYLTRCTPIGKEYRKYKG